MCLPLYTAFFSRHADFESHSTHLIFCLPVLVLKCLVVGGVCFCMRRPTSFLASETPPIASSLTDISYDLVQIIFVTSRRPVVYRNSNEVNIEVKVPQVNKEQQLCCAVHGPPPCVNLSGSQPSDTDMYTWHVLQVSDLSQWRLTFHSPNKQGVWWWNMVPINKAQQPHLPRISQLTQQHSAWIYIDTFQNIQMYALNQYIHVSELSQTRLISHKAFAERSTCTV